jgi:hypothetical protein
MKTWIAELFRMWEAISVEHSIHECVYEKICRYVKASLRQLFKYEKSLTHIPQRHYRSKEKKYGYCTRPNFRKRSNSIFLDNAVSLPRN